MKTSEFIALLQDEINKNGDKEITFGLEDCVYYQTEREYFDIHSYELETAVTFYKSNDIDGEY